jgi:hypothetical protein
MKNKWLLLFCLLIPLILVFPACSESGEAAQETVSIGTRLTALESGEATVFKLYDKRLTAVEAKPSGTSVDLGPLNTNVTTLQNEVSTLKSEVAALKTAVAALKPTTYTTPAGTTAGTYGELVDTDGDLELWLEKTSGDVSDVFVTRNGVCSGRFDFIVVNKDTGSSHDYRISLALTPESDVVLKDNATSFSTTKNFITASGGMLFTMSRVNSARNPLNAYQTNEDRITKGTTEDVTVWITVEQESSSSAITEWDYSVKVDDRD